MPPPPQANLGARRIDELEGLRGLLALWVVVSHVVCLCGLDAVRPALVPRSIWEWLVYAGTAVNVFVILSGFAIFKMLRATPPGYGAFVTGRAFRLFPVYLTCLALTLALISVSGFVSSTAPWHSTDYFQRWTSDLANVRAHWPVQLALQLPLLHGLAPPGWPPPQGISDVLPPAWSATLEWQFYLVAPALLSFGPGRRGGRFLAGLLALAVVAALFLAADDMTYGGFLGLKLWLFVVGMISAFLHGTHDAAASAMPRWWWLPGFALAAFLTYVFHDPAPLLWLAAFAVIFAPHQPLAAAGSWLLTRRPLLWLGRISYSLYLLHWPLLVGGLALVLRLAPGIKGTTAAVWLLAAGLPVILLLAGRLHAKLEAPLMRYGRRLAGRTV